MASPAYRNWLLCRGRKGQDHLVDAVLDGYVEGEALKACKSLYDDKLTKVYVEACLIATEDFAQISDTLEIDPHVLMLYHDLYYDVHGLSRLHKVEHIASIDDAEEKRLKQWALANGIGFIRWRIGLVDAEDPVSQARGLLSDAYYKSKEAFFNANTAAASDAGMKWSKHAMAIIKQLQDMESGMADEAADELRLELDKINEENVNLISLGDLE